MIPFRTETFAAPAPLTGAAGGMVQSRAGAPLRDGSAVLDFAGLLNAAMPAAATLTLDAAQGATVEQVAPDGAMLPAQLLPATRLPNGTKMPDGGTDLPEAAPMSASEAEPLPGGLAADTQAPIAAAMPVQTEDAAEFAAATTAEPEDTDDTAPAPIGSSVPAPVALAVAIAAMPPAPATLTAATTRPASRALHSAAAPPIQVENAAMPERATLFSESGDAPATPSAPAALPTLAEAAAPDAAPAQQAAPAPAPAPAPTTASLTPAPTANPVMAERAEPRAPAANQESTIAQVGELREALRAARPEMTLRHAEFGFVSLRIEATGTQDWRAVLASRDPGFVPAVQAALADRAVAAASDTASTGNSAGQHGASDQRYGSSPNGGQGSSQPYLAHSSGRDEGGSSRRNEHQPSTTDTVAGRAGDSDAEQADPRMRGVFA